MSEQSAYPLSWPLGWKRHNGHRERARFGLVSMDRVAREILRELELMGVGDWNVVISTNVELRRDGLPYSNRRVPADPGAAVYFRLRDQPRVLACDRWDLPEHNLRAIAKHIEAVRGQARWGVGSVEQAFSGYAALPERGTTSPWHEALGIPRDATAAEVREALARALKSAHPDNGGSTAQLGEVLAAKREVERLGILAKDPT